MRKLSDAGDTLVEVMLAIAIVSFVLVAAYATANKNTLLNQDTQERSQALQLGSAQIEFLHTTSIGAFNCFSVAGQPVGTGGATAPSNAPCIVKADGTPAGGAQPAYTIMVTTSGGTSTVNVSWDSLVRAGKDFVVLYYQS